MDTVNSIDYEAIWSGVWGDMQRYGPIHRHHRRIFSEMIACLPKEEVLSVADVGCGEGSNLIYLQKEFPRASILGDRKSTRLNSSHLGISYAVFCLKKKKQNN